MKSLFVIAACALLGACSAAQQTNLQQFNANVAADLTQFNTAAAPVVKNLACLDATGAQISGPLLAATGNAAGVVVGAAGSAAAQAVCPANTTAAVVSK